MRERSHIFYNMNTGTLMTVSKMHKIAGSPIDLVVVDQPSWTMNKGSCGNTEVKGKWRRILFHVA